MSVQLEGKSREIVKLSSESGESNRGELNQKLEPTGGSHTIQIYFHEFKCISCTI